MAQSPSTVSHPELGLNIQLFEPYSNLAPKVRAAFSDKDIPKPHYHDAKHGLRLYQGDALQLLRRAKSETFDLIFADPPYFLSNGGITCQNGQMVSVNKGDWDKAITFEQIHAFNLQWLRECHRLLKTDGAIWVSGTSHNIYSVGFAMQTLGFKVLNDIAWHKTNPPPHLACRYFTHAHETLLWARKTPKSKHFFDYASMKHDNSDKQMQSVWKLPAPNKWEKRFGKHPTQKPEILLNRIIRASSRPADLVLDPFCGSGTTGAVAARLGRRFVGFEMELAFIEIATSRLQDECKSEQLAISFSCAKERWNVIFPPRGPRYEPTWASLVRWALAELGGEANLNQIYERLAEHERTRTVPTWTCTIRRVVREGRGVVPLGSGRYKLVAA